MTGKVIYQNAPVANMVLTLYFDAPAGESFTQFLPLGDDGTFAGEVPKSGNYKIVLNESMAVMEGIKKAEEVKRMKVPSKYKDPATSDITWSIAPGSNDRMIELKD